jgi:TatA/E family protein of Tat protein translocase
MTGAMFLPELPIGFLEAIGPSELVLVMLIALMLFGGDKLPELARGLGKSMREFKKVTGNVQDELRKAMQETETSAHTIMPPTPASPEIKSTPGNPPPGLDPEDPGPGYHATEEYSPLPSPTDPHHQPIDPHPAPPPPVNRIEPGPGPGPTAG